MSNAKPTQPSNRLPAPALFVGPPSHNTSTPSLLSPSQTNSSRAPLTRQRSLLSGNDSKRPPAATPAPGTYDGGDYLSATSSNPSAPFTRRQKAQSAAADADASSRAEAIWAEMQNTLEEVELSAIKGPGMTVFGSEHSKALEELRRAQIDLAQAWARSEADEAGQAREDGKDDVGGDVEGLLSPAAAAAASAVAHAAGHPPVTGGSTFERSKLEGETEKDIELSRKRREANDRYFEKVNKGVLEVVNRLEEVAKAMKGVESESKEIWTDGDSGESITTGPSVA